MVGEVKVPQPEIRRRSPPNAKDPMRIQGDITCAQSACAFADVRYNSENCGGLLGDRRMRRKDRLNTRESRRRSRPGYPSGRRRAYTLCVLVRRAQRRLFGAPAFLGRGRGRNGPRGRLGRRREPRGGADTARRSAAGASEAGKNPMDARRATRVAAGRNVDTSARSTEKMLESEREGNPQQAETWTNGDRRFETGERRPLWSRRVDEIDTAAVLETLTPLWNEKRDLASRLRGRIEAVLDAAGAQGHRTGENPARWRGHLQTPAPRGPETHEGAPCGDALRRRSGLPSPPAG